MGVRTVGLIVVLLCLAATSIGDAVGQQSPGADTGLRIGTIIRTAIDTALPGVSAITDLIWKKRPSNKDTIKQAELNTAVASARADIKKETTTNFQKQLEPLTHNVDELVIVNSFLKPVVEAKENVVRMQARIEGSPAKDNPVWARLDTDWKVATAQLEQVAKVPDTDLAKLQNIWLRNMLTGIRGAKADDVIRVSAALSQRDAQDLQKQLERLSTRLQDVVAVVGYELEDTRKQLADLAQSSASTSGPKFAAETNEWMEYLDSRYPSGTGR